MVVDKEGKEAEELATENGAGAAVVVAAEVEAESKEKTKI